jgi:hypothetical protein
VLVGIIFDGKDNAGRKKKDKEKKCVIPVNENPKVTHAAYGLWVKGCALWV